ncbi:MAG: ABC transporter permease [Candidatus Caldatribacteriaceae bacterium]
MLSREQIFVRVGRNWVVLFLFLLCVLFSFTGRGFLSLKTLNNILLTSAPALLLAAGETFVIITGGIDLSVGFVRGFISVISAIVIRDLYAMGYFPYFAIACGVVVGVLLGFLSGLVNGVLVAKLKVPPFIATFGMYGIAYGLSEIICNNVPIAGLPPLVGFIGNGYLLYYLPGKALTFLSPP